MKSMTCVRGLVEMADSSSDDNNNYNNYERRRELKYAFSCG